MKTKDRIYGRMVKKIVAGVLMITLTVSIPVAQKQESMVKAETVSRRVEWNIKCLNAEKSYEESKNLKKIKVAILDSGLDYDEDLPAVEKKDFLGEEELHPLYQDMTGHGTSVASLICARENEDRITGIAANVELYIGRIFGYGNDAPVDRVVKAVNWAIDRKVNIIHMSFGTQEYSGELEDAIEKAYKSGILIIAAAGNAGQAPEDESTIEYPAAFDNVISVGATNKYNNMSDFSSTGTELDVVAPGDQILTDGAFGGVSVDNGTSISAAQVTGVAAVLWGKHPDKSNEFIKSLLVGSANKEAVNSEDCGEGLVDYKEADNNYEKMNKAYQEYKKEGISEKKAVEKAEGQMPENVKSVEEHGEVNYVNASWSKENHKSMADNANNEDKNPVYVDAININFVKMGAVQTDNLDNWKGIHENGCFNGTGNYFANTHYLYCMAKKYIGGIASFPTDNELKVNGKSLNKKSISIISGKLKAQNALTDYFKSFQNERYELSKEYNKDLLVQVETDVKTQGYVLLGAAIHNITDALSHRVCKQTSKKYGSVWCGVIHDCKPEKENRKDAKSTLWRKYIETGMKKKEEKETEEKETVKLNGNQKFFKYMLKNFAIADNATPSEQHPEVLNHMANQATIAAKSILASLNSQETWYNIMKNNIRGDGKLKLANINEYWSEFVNIKNAKFGKKLAVPKSKKKLKKIELKYTLKGEGKTQVLQIRSNKKYGCVLYISKTKGKGCRKNGILVKEDENNQFALELRKNKPNIIIENWLGTNAKFTKVCPKFKIKYSCRGMKNVRLKKGIKNKIQVAKIGKNVTFKTKGKIFEMTKGKKKLKGWRLKKTKGNKAKRFSLNTNVVYPQNRGDNITLYPIFE